MSRIRFTGSTTPPTPASGQLFLFVDSADKHLKQIDDTGTISDITGGAGTDTTAIHDDTAAEISAITAKVTPTGSDFLLIEDAADSNNKKRITIGNLPSSGSADYGALSSPPTGGTYLDGDRYFDTTIARAMFRDATRSKWLSTECMHVAFMSAYALDEGEYLNIGHLYLDPSALGNDRGYQIPLASTIVGIGWAKDSSNTTPIIEILSDATVVATVSPPTSTAGNKGSDLTIDADMAADSVMACRNKDQGTTPPEPDETIYMPVVWVNYRWKR